jgi:peptide/nickel transport system substrate-binding protein
MLNRASFKRVNSFGLGLTMLLLLFVLGVSQAATPTSKSAPPAAVKPQYGGTLKIITTYAVNSLGNPVGTRQWSDRLITRTAIETIVSFDDKGMVVPGLAESWVISPDHKSITFKLRKGVKFHDGTDLNAEAAKYCLELYKNSPLPDLKSVTSIDVIDNNTLRLTLANWDNLLLGNLAQRAGYIVSPTTAKAHDTDWLTTHPVGTGPFKLAAYKHGESAKFERFDGYWQKGKPYLDAIEFIFVEDPVVASAAFQRAEGQAIHFNSLREIINLKNTNKYSLHICPNGLFGLVGDSLHPNSIYSDIRIRRAVEHAIDKRAIVDAIGKGILEPLNQPASSKHWSYNPKVIGYPYDPTKAKQLLSQAGYPNGFKTRIICRNLPDDVAAFTAVQGYLANVGIDAQMNVMGQSEYFELANPKGWENGLLQFAMGLGRTDDPVQAMQLRMSGKGQSHKSVAYPPAYDAKIAAALKAFDFKTKQARIQEAVKMAIDDYAIMIPIWMGVNAAFEYPQVHGTRLMDPSNEWWTPADAWLSK